MTEYALETKRARKELSAFSNHRRTVGTGNRAPQNRLVNTGNENSSHINNDTLHNELRNEYDDNDDRIGISPRTDAFCEIDDIDMLERPSTLNFDLEAVGGKAPAEDGEIVVLHGSPLSPSLLSTIQTPLSGIKQCHRSMSRSSQPPRLSRARLRMTDDERMMVTIATEEEDDSTSSTDVDNSALLTPSPPPSASSPPAHSSTSLPCKKRPNQRRRKRPRKSRALTASQTSKMRGNSKSPPSLCESSGCPRSVDTPSPESDGSGESPSRPTRGKFHKRNRGANSKTYKAVAQCCDHEQIFKYEEREFHKKSEALSNLSPQALSQANHSKSLIEKQHNTPIRCDDVLIPLVESPRDTDKHRLGRERVADETSLAIEENDEDLGVAPLDRAFRKDRHVDSGNNDCFSRSLFSRDNDSVELSSPTNYTKGNANSVINETEPVKPVEGGLRDVKPVEGGVRDVKPVEGAVRDVKPVEGGVRDVKPVEGGVRDVKPVEGGVRDVKPVEGGVRDATELARPAHLVSGEGRTHPALTFCSSVRDNGYLADTEHLTGTHQLPAKHSKLSFFLSKLGDEEDEDYGDDDDDVSLDSWMAGDRKQSRSTTIQTITSPEMTSPSPAGADMEGMCSSSRFLPGSVTSCRARSLTPLGLFRIRQSGLVQRSVTLTYLLTFFYLFACLLQLYTAFGVYGVLATSRVPAPWPWFVFHSIYR